MRISTILRTSVLAFAAASLTGCYHHHGRGHAHGQPDPVVDACILGACVAGSYLGPRHAHPAVAVAAGATAAALYLAVNEGHHHGHRCGCPTRWHNGYRAYYWGGHWEYHDGRGWCTIDGAPGPSW